MKNFNYLMNHILYQILKDFVIFKKHGEKTVNSLIRRYINKIENRITLKQDIISNF